MDNNQEELQVEQETAEVEETTTEETTTEEETHEDTVVISKEKFKAMQKKAIAYDASKKTPQNITNNSLTREEAEEMLLKTSAKLSDEDMKVLKTVAKGEGISLIQATENPLFKAYQEKMVEERKREQAKLGASRGSSVSQGKASFTTPGLSAEDHKKLWKEAMSK